MLKSTGFLALSMAIASLAHSQSADIATGNMHFDAKAMDANGDQMITRDEMMQYGSKMWDSMSKGADKVPVKDAALAFAQGNLRFSAKAMDTDHDGTVSKDEFMKYGGAKFDKMKKTDGMISVDDATKYFSTGNMRPNTDLKPKKPVSPAT